MTTDVEAFWDTRPQRRLEWREDDDGQCVVLRPRLGEGRVGRWLASKLPDPYYRIRLDAVGTFVWKACDGDTTLRTIATRMRDHFGADVEPAEERLGTFVQTMVRSKMISVADTGS